MELGAYGGVGYIINSIVSVIHSHIHRCQNLTVRCVNPTTLQAVFTALKPTSLPALVTLEGKTSQVVEGAYVDLDFSQRTPRLRNFLLKNVFLSYKYTWILTTLRTVTLHIPRRRSLESISRIPPHLVYFTLVASPNLVVLKIQDIDVQEAPDGHAHPQSVPNPPLAPNPPGTILIHQNIKKIQLPEGRVDIVNAFLPYFRMPSLKMLQGAKRFNGGRCTFTSDSLRIIAARKSTFPSLVDIDIRLDPRSPGTARLWEVLGGLSKLQSLKLECFLETETMKIGELARICPELERIEVWKSKGVTLRMLKELVEMRMGDPGYAALTRLELISCDHEVDEVAMKWLQSLEGFTLYVRSG